MIYLDSSVVLARLLSEPRHAPDSLWDDPVISSRLLEYEVWNRIHAHGLTHELGWTTRTLLQYIDFIELTPPILARALEPFPVAVRTLDALHLATADYARRQDRSVELASFDGRMAAAARALGIAICDI